MDFRPAYPIGQTNPFTNPFDPLPTTKDTVETSLTSDETHSTPLRTHWKGQSWSYRRMAPALLVMIACITGVVCSLIWSFYLLIPFGPGFLASWYLLHIGCHDQELITLSENLDVLNGKIEELDKEIKAFAEENQKLKQTLTGYVDLYQKFTVHIKGLSNLKIEFDEANIVAKTNNQTAQRTIERFGDLIEEFRSFGSNFTSGQERLEEMLGLYRGQIEEQAAVFTTHLESLAKLMDDPERREAYREHVKLVKEQAEIQERMAATATKLEENTKHVAELAKIKKGLEQEVAKLTTQVSRLEQATSSIL